MINKLRYGAAGVAIAAAMGMGSVAHAADNADATAQAEILAALTLDLQTGTLLDFGQMVVNGADTVVLDPAANLTCGTNLVCSGTPSVPAFDISGGTANKDVTVNLPTSAITLLRQGGTGGVAADEIELDTFTASSTTVTLDGAGDGTFTVGGTIHIDGTESAGVFDGTFNVSVEYA